MESWPTEDTMKLVKAREERKRKITQCIDVKVCPKCGNIGISRELFRDGGIDYNCHNPDCDWKHST